MFQSETVHIGDDPRTFVIEGVLDSGTIEYGMLMVIGLNRSFSMTVPITNVLTIGADRWRSVLNFKDVDCKDVDCKDGDGAQFLETMDKSQESLEIVPSTDG